MLRIPKLSLVQVFLIVALAALVLAILGISLRRWSVNHTLPPLALSPNGKSLAIGLSVRPLFERRHPIVIRDLATSGNDQLYEYHDWCIQGVTYSPDGSQLYSVGDSTMRVWDTSTGKEVQQFDTGASVESGLAVSPDGTLVATANDKQIRITNLETGGVTRFGAADSVTTLEFSPDGTYLVSGGWGSQIEVWDTKDWSLSNTIKAPAHVSFLPDGRLVAPHYIPATKQEPFRINVAIYEMPSGDVKVILPLDSYAAISSIATTLDGKLIAAAHGGKDEQMKRAITIWDASSFQELKTLSVKSLHDRWVDDMVFSNDGETLYCASNNNTVSAQHWLRNDAESFYRSGKVFPWPLTLIGSLIWLAAWFLSTGKRGGMEKTTDAGSAVRSS